MAVNTIKLLRYVPTAENPDYALVQAVETGNYTTGGDTINLNPGTWTDPAGQGVLGVPTNVSTLPVAVDSESIGGNYAEVIAGATLATHKLKLYAPGGAEVGAGAVPAAVTGGTIVLRVPLR